MRFYLRLYWAALLARLQYRADLVISIITSLLMQASALAFFHVFFANASTALGWQAPSVLLLFGIVAMAFGFSELLFNGIWNLPVLVMTGRLDRILISPADSLVFMLVSNPQLHAIGNLLSGAGMIGAALAALHAPAGTCWLLPIWVLSAGLTYTAVLVALGGLSLVFVGPHVSHLELAAQLLNSTRYPLGVYPPWMRLLLLFVLPLGAATHWPALWLRGEGDVWMSGGVPALTALVSCVLASFVWRLGLMRYQGAGN